MSTVNLKVDELKKIYSIFHQLSNQALKKGMFEDTAHVVTLHTALQKFKGIIDESDTGKGEKYPIDNSTGNPIASRNRRNIPKKETTKIEEPKGTTGTGTDEPGTGTVEVKQLSIVDPVNGQG